MLPRRKAKNPTAGPKTTPKDNNLVNVVDQLQLQIEEERSRASKKIVSPPPEPIAEYKTPLAKKTIQKKKIAESKPNNIIENQILPPPVEEKPVEKERPKYADSVTESIEPMVPQPKKLTPTGFTYFDMLNEKDIMEPMSDD